MYRLSLPLSFADEVLKAGHLPDRRRHFDYRVSNFETKQKMGCQSTDLLLFYILFEGILIPMFLITDRRHSEGQEQATTKGVIG